MSAVDSQLPSSSSLSPYSKASRSPRSAADLPNVYAFRSGSGLLRQKSSASTDRAQDEAYFTDLLSYSLERLGKEPELLTAEREQLKRQSQESAVQHYRGFIEVAKCLRILKDKVEAVGEHLDVLEADLPKLDEACDDFTKDAKEHVAKRSQNKQLLKQHGVLIEILEVPSLMDTCLRGGSYDDALDLRAFVAKIALLHPKLEVVQSLVRETDAISEEMFSALLSKLKSNIQLPECLRVVAHLRRLAPFSEAKLRQTFLLCREEWLTELVMALDDSNAYDYLKRLTDIHRLQLFDIVMQFRAIFSDDASSLADSSDYDGAAIYSWAEHRIIFYIEALAKQLPRIREGGALASVLEHCMYCGMSLGRVGLDFRGLLPPIFEACILTLFTSSVQTAVETSLVMLDSHKWVAPQAALSRRKGFAQPPERQASGKEGGPPYSLMDYPPFAVLTNGLLTALNELRHCAPLSLQPRLAAILQESLQGVVRAMAHYTATRNFSEEERGLVQNACTALTQTACPYIAKCFSRVYTDSQPGLDLDSITSALTREKSVDPESKPEQGSEVVLADTSQPAGDLESAEQ